MHYRFLTTPVAAMLLMLSFIANAQFIQVKNGRFYPKKVHGFLGTNYWYGGLLYNNVKQGGHERLKRELDFLNAQGVKNLRVFIAFEGDSTYPYRVYPSLQAQAGIYNEQLLIGFDHLLVEAAKRKMHIVLVLGNNWEWSGGFGQYLEWNGYGVPPLPKTKDWDWEAYCTFISQFYSCANCVQQYHNWARHIVNRKSTITGLLYKNDPTIMSWELANEPRPMTDAAVPNYIQWIKNTADSIKRWDKNHLVTIGTEGIISTRMAAKIWETIHQHPTIDYCTLHLWPKTWQWYNGRSEEAIADSTLQKTEGYILQHALMAQKLNKPLVIEEFGLHRDGNSFSAKSNVSNRNAYYQFVFKVGNDVGIAGYNFWGFAGLPNNETTAGFMHREMPYSADPPQEEQGLYSVMMSDSTTWQVIRHYKQSSIKTKK